MQLHCVYGPTLNENTELQHYKCGNTVDIRNRIMFDFYPGLPQLLNIWIVHQICVHKYLLQFFQCLVILQCSGKCYDSSCSQIIESKAVVWYKEINGQMHLI